MFISYPNNRKVVGIRIYRVLADDTFKFLVTPYISDSTKLTPEEEQAAISLSRDCAPGTRTYIRTILRSDKKDWYVAPPSIPKPDLVGYYYR